ncbi:PAXIP1-associated glutamate-rich protein 1 [Ctenocephalides felis]|uniref:PAXIP1-associated glutamate-rich protein 1 n=1 Tax=Ctenocephalides felis TaxID=7515 RepID=UPI000E6E4298|nr:PAXIP1-associated glutamate-rich protein 1 [Ctenocephalides felis]XP_026477296.1 PAXIP1-associated glutamate-rich protein 1 [Ctenocephalides felis]
MTEENGENSSNDDWSVACSDDELATDGDGNWYPPPADLEVLFEELEKNGILQLQWKCPGRRPPSPIGNEETSNNSDQESNDEKKSNFEFMDEMSSPQIRVRVAGENELKGSAKKKTSSFDGILLNMKRHRQLNQELEQKPE